MFKQKLKFMALPLIAVLAVFVGSSFTETGETPTLEKKVDVSCPFPSTKTIKGCVQGFSTCTPEGNC